MAQKLSRPPFRVGDCVALAYVSGRYTPPGPKPGPAGFLGIYVAGSDPVLSFWTFDRSGRQLAFSLATTTELNVEFTLILGWLKYAVPFDQWRWYDMGKSEAAELRRLKLGDTYGDARRRLRAVLYQARFTAYFGLPKLKPMFAIRPRSVGSMKKDVTERNAVLDFIAPE